MTMSTSARAGALARHLLPFLARVGRGDGAEPVDAGQAVVEPAEPDIDHALLIELRHLSSQDPALRRLLADDSREGRQQAMDRLAELLAQTDGHSLELMWALVAGHADHPPTPPRQPNGWRSFTRLLTNGWLRRQAASGSMNVLIVLVIIVTWWFVWRPAESRWPAGPTVLAVFALWCLSFLPGWLYIRFLGKRAGALWDEYVLNLHRLGWDKPAYLPRPPVTSEFYAEWVRDGGHLYACRQNIYQQKFSAYYGQSMSGSQDSSESGVKIETLFPVFLLTIMLAAAWAAVLWDATFVTAPIGGWDVLKYGFLGAYLFIIQTLIRRFFQGDLRPSAYASAVLRVLVVLIIVAALHQLTFQVDVRTEVVIAFVVGFFPLIGLQALQRVAATTLRIVVPSLSPDYPLNQIEGLNIWYEARLLEEGIEDMQNLTTANLVDVILHTRVPVSRVVDWVDQAHLYMRLDRTERTSRERRAANKNADKIRTGTSDRHTLRQQGIRTATDLLKAFPPTSKDAPTTPDEAHKWQILVLVLSQESSLTPVWNWQRHGVPERLKSTV